MQMNPIAIPTNAEILRKRLHSHCFACAPENQQGLGLAFSTEADGITRMTWAPSPDYQSYDGRVHGGILATLIDASMVHALFARGVAGVTAEMKIRYYSPAELGAPVTLSTQILAHKLGLYRLCAEIFQNERLVARADAKFMTLQAV